MLKKFVQIFGGDPNKREIDRYSELVVQINNLEANYETLSQEELGSKTNEFRQRLAIGETLDDILPEVFAATREASKRTIGLRPYDVQLIGGSVLHHGKIAEMRTGEGKTLVATLPLYLNALAINPEWIKLARNTWGENPEDWVFEPIDEVPVGRGVHLVTVNDYLARRDARWMGPIFQALGLSIGVLQMAARTENGKKAFLVDYDRTSPHEDQHNLRMVPRQEAYRADITYGTNSEFGFDYLRDNMTMRLEDRVQRGHYYAIVDEVDNVLIDEARTPLIISGPAQDEAEWYIRMAQVVRTLRPEDYEISEKDRTVTLTELGEGRVEEALGTPLRDPDRPEDITMEQARLLGYLEQGLRAQHLFKRNKDYLVQAGKVVIIDEFTGRLMPGRRWSDGLHQAVEAKEGVKVQSESVTYATITIQNYFRMYEKLAGMTGTAVTEAEEFDKIYKLGVLAIPTNLEYMASRQNSDLIEADGRDEKGYKYQYYASKGDPSARPVFWKRKDYPDVVYRTEEAKLRSIAREILRYHALGRPMLVGTTSVEMSDRLSNRLRAEPLRRLCQIILIRSFWMEQNNREEDGRVIQELQYLSEPLEKLDTAEMRKMARDINISFNPEDPANIERLLQIFELPEEVKSRLISDLQGGIPHQVLNARKHAEESQIIAGAGAFGAVTIATNMAGRGVDIKLGGELAEEIISSVNRVLHRAGYQDPYDMTLEERRRALLELEPADYGIYESEINFFMRHIDDMEMVHALGGLHVIGSERHEARRIDNQLRGRSARQGDPGSSRFYLSMEDELMRLFGGQQADNLMQRLRVDDSMPLEVGLVSRLVEQSQTRVEGANFDVRKHLLEYDDVLNTQRASIYSQRNRIFVKDDLSEDVTEMLRSEVNRRIPDALKDEGGPWKLLAWLDQIQPPLQVNNTIYPPFSLQLLVNHVLNGRTSLTPQDAVTALTDVARNSIRAEQEHIFQAVESLLDQTQERLEAQIKERMEEVDTYFEGLTLDDEDAPPRRPVDMINEISELVHFPIKLSPDGQRALKEKPQLAADEVQAQIENALVNQTVNRLIGSVERRLEDSIELAADKLDASDWNTLADQILHGVEMVFDNRILRLLGDGTPGTGQLTRKLENAIPRGIESVDQNMLLFLLLMMPQGERALFDKKTHKRVWARTQNLSYIYYAAHFLEGEPTDFIAADVLDHLERAQTMMFQLWGQMEWNRVPGRRVADLGYTTQQWLLERTSPTHYGQIENSLLEELPVEDKEQVIDLLGRQTLTAIYRQLLLSVITELWVEYLTQMEALRVSIGLEAYAQRDPLVQYKNRAFGLFQELLSNMRYGVVNRMFTFRPREGDSSPATLQKSIEEQPRRTETIKSEPSSHEMTTQSIAEDDEEDLEEVEAQAPGASLSSANQNPPNGGNQPGGGKKKRRRHR